MYAVSRKILTGGEFDEHWSHYGHLSISYRDATEHYVNYINGKWQCDDTIDEQTRSYLCCAAEIADAIDECINRGYDIKRLNEFLCPEHYPSELLRVLLDEMGLGIYYACEIMLKCYGKRLATLLDIPFPVSIQPRTAMLTDVLKSSLNELGFAYFDAYDTDFRAPFGAVECGTELSLSLLTFGGVSEAFVCFECGYVNFELPMQRLGDYFTCTYTPTQSGAYGYCFKLLTDSGKRFVCADEGGHLSVISEKSEECFRLTVFEQGFETPDWFKHSVMYQIFPDRFGFSLDNTAKNGIEYHTSLGQTPELHGSITEPVRYMPRSFETNYLPDDFYGGTLKGIQSKLPYLKELGISVIYLNPIFEARSNHRYDTSDYGKIDPVLGNEIDYVNLCSEAQRLGIRIILDGVFSHTGADSVYFNRYSSYDSVGAYQGDSSPYYPWYSFDTFPDKYRCWWGFKELPEVDEHNGTWQDYIINSDDSIVRKWLRLGASGWRLDVADELPDEVLSLIRKAAKLEKPDSVIIGEVWEDAVTKESYGKRRNYALGYSLDSVMNYPFRRAVIDFALGKTDAFALRDFLLSQMANYPKPLYLSLMNLLGSHDVERLHTALCFDFEIKSLSREQQAYLSISAEQKERADTLQKLCAAIQYSVAGVPCLYYGDEECFDGGCDPFNRTPFEPSRCGLHNFYSKLGQLRNKNAELSLGSMWVSAPSPDILEITREYQDGKIVCIINKSNDLYSIPYNNCTSLLDNNNIDTVPPMSAEIYKFT